MKRIIFVTAILIFAITLFASEPVSKQAIIVQRYASGEVEMQAEGIYNSGESSKTKKKSDVKKNGVERAIEDAKKSAIYYLLHSAPDPILQDGEARARFNSRGAFIYEPASVNRIVTYIHPDNQSAITINDGQGQKISKTLRVNKNAIIVALENAGIFDTGNVVGDSALDRLETEAGKVPVATINLNTPTPTARDPFAELDARTSGIGADAPRPTTPGLQPADVSTAPANSRMGAFQAQRNTAQPNITAQTLQPSIDELCRNIPAGSTIALPDIDSANVDSNLKDSTYELITNILTDKGYTVVQKGTLAQQRISGRATTTSKVDIARNANAAFLFEATMTENSITLINRNAATNASTTRTVQY